MLIAQDTSFDIDSVSKKVWELWIPAQKDVVQTVTRKIKDNLYENSISSLIEDLKKDISLYLYTIRILADKSNFQSIISTSHFSSGNQFKMLLPLFEEFSKLYCRDRLVNASNFQLELLKENILSSTLTESLGPTFNVERGTAYTIASLKSLGRLLLAWNYPKQFEQAISIVSGSPLDTTLDTVLSNIFGFTPSTLGAKVALQMGFGENISKMINKIPLQTSVSISTSSIHNRLDCICTFGETFSQIHSTLPSSINKKETKDLMNFLTKSLGEQGLAKVYEIAGRTCSEYSKKFPAIFPGITVDKEHIASGKVNDRIEVSRLARKAGLDDSTEIQNLVCNIHEKEDGKELLKKFLHTTLEKSGISSVLIFAVSPIDVSLLPVFRKGTPTFVRAEESPLYSSNYNNSLIRDAFTEKKSQLAKGHGKRKEPIVVYVCPINQKNPVGVVYLEGEIDNISAEKIKSLGELVSSVMLMIYTIPEKKPQKVYERKQPI